MAVPFAPVSEGSPWPPSKHIWVGPDGIPIFRRHEKLLIHWRDTITKAMEVTGSKPGAPGTLDVGSISVDFPLLEVDPPVP